MKNYIDYSNHATTLLIRIKFQALWTKLLLITSFKIMYSSTYNNNLTFCNMLPGSWVLYVFMLK